MSRVPILMLLLLSACSGGDHGAVVVRWRLVDATTGAAPSGGCANKSIDGAFCCAAIGGADIIIDSVGLLVTSPAAEDGGMTVAPCGSCCFECNPSEHTTQFELAPGDYELSLRAFRCGALVGQTPPAVIRTVRAAEITNLNAVEILLRPTGADAPSTCPAGDGGVPAAPFCP